MEKKSMVVSDNTVAVESLGTSFKNLGRSSATTGKTFSNKCDEQSMRRFRYWSQKS